MILFHMTCLFDILKVSNVGTEASSEAIYFDVQYPN